MVEAPPGGLSPSGPATRLGGEDLADRERVFDRGDHTHWPATVRAGQGVDRKRSLHEGGDRNALEGFWPALHGQVWSQVDSRRISESPRRGWSASGGDITDCVAPSPGQGCGFAESLARRYCR